ncbi:hypothetical protein ACFX2I_029617 [Malus domestica]
MTIPNSNRIKRAKRRAYPYWYIVEPSRSSRSVFKRSQRFHCQPQGFAAYNRRRRMRRSGGCGGEKMIEVVLNDRLGKKVRVKCNEDDTIGDLKKLVAAQTGTRPDKIRIQKWYNIYKDHITLKDYEIHDGMGLELYYN